MIFTDAGLVKITIRTKEGDFPVELPVYELDAEIRLAAQQMVAANEKRVESSRPEMSAPEVAAVYAEVFGRYQVPRQSVGGYLHLVQWVQDQIAVAQKKTLYYENVELPSSMDFGPPTTNGSSEH